MGKTAGCPGKQLAWPQPPEDGGRASEGSSPSRGLGEEGLAKRESLAVGVGVGWD